MAMTLGNRKLVQKKGKHELTRLASGNRYDLIDKYDMKNKFCKGG